MSGAGLERQSRESIGAAPGVVQTAIAVAGILALAVAMQIHFGAFGDVSWLLTVCEGWLDGKTPYVDLIETNPPLAILLYMPATLFARLTPVRAEAAIAVFGLVAACASAALTSSILKRADLLPRPAPLFDAILLVALVLLPGRTFDERDFFALLLGLPFVAIATARATQAPSGSWLLVTTGIGAGLMIALKPPYAAIPALLLLPIWRRRGLLAALLSPEIFAAAATVFVMLAATWLLFPAYFTVIAPIIATAYLPVRESLPTLIANAGVIVALTIGGLAIASWPRSRPSPVTLSFLLAAAGAAVAYFVQGKGWLYHIYPALALAVIAFGAALERRDRDRDALVVAGALAALTLAGAILYDLPPLNTALIGAVAAWLLMALFAGNDSRERLTVLAGGALTGAASGFYALSFPGPDPAFVKTMLSYRQHPRIASISEGLGAGFPLVRNVDGVWTMSLQGLLMTAAARLLIDQHPHDAALKAKLEPIIGWERDIAAGDIEREKPDVLLVGRNGPRFHAWSMSDPALSAARAPYRFIMSNPNPDWPVDLYVRDDLTKPPTGD